MPVRIFTCDECGHHLASGEVNTQYFIDAPVDPKVATFSYSCAACGFASVHRVSIADFWDGPLASTRDQYKDFFRRVMRQCFNPENSPKLQLIFERANSEPITKDEQNKFFEFMDTQECLSVLNQSVHLPG